ncbi:MAG: type I glutamate--ammonia ligase, partial [Lachnospiraceae bacterium]|nr:type I glutamate--ammonia ligase [Lachnospiraceae bacterium]
NLLCSQEIHPAFLFHTDEEGRPTTLTHERASYFDMAPLDLGENARRDIVLTLESMGFEIEASHHEVAPAQHEIDFKYDNALKTADNVMTLKLVVKTVAKRHGLYASFMPKPLTDVDGSGMHINMSLNKDGENVFADASSPDGLSKECKYFIAGLIRHARAMSIFTNPLVNSYKRLVPGYEAPVQIAWSSINRSPLIRIPAARGASTRIEYRSPDSAVNPYLVMAVCLAAGLDGIKNKIEPPAPVNMNFYEMSEQEIKDAQIESLPRDLNEACQALEEDDFIKNVLGDHVVDIYMKAKKQEWANYSRQVSDWEVSEYLYKY